MQVAGYDALATPSLYEAMEEVLVASLMGADNVTRANVHVVGALNSTACPQPAGGPSTIGLLFYPGAPSPHADVQRANFQAKQTVSEQSILDQIVNADGSPPISVAGRKLLALTYDPPPPLGPPHMQGDCLPLVTVTMQFTNLDGVNGDFFNKTLETIYNGRFLAKLQAKGVDVVYVELVSFLEPGDSTTGKSREC